MVWVNENMLLSWIIARRYWSDELVVWWPIGWQKLLLITKELLDLYISRNTVAWEPCAMKSFRIYLPISAFIASFLEGKSGTITNPTILSYTIHRDKLFCRPSHYISLYLNNLSKHFSKKKIFSVAVICQHNNKCYFYSHNCPSQKSNSN